MSTGSSADASIDLNQLAALVEPPEADTRVNVFYEEDEAHLVAVFHEKDCEKRRSETEPGIQEREVCGTVNELKQMFKTQATQYGVQALQVCYLCYYDRWQKAEAFMSAIGDDTGKNWVQTSLNKALYLENEGGKNWRKWVEWFAGISLAELHVKGRQLGVKELGLPEQVNDKDLVLCFERTLCFDLTCAQMSCWPHRIERGRIHAWLPKKLAVHAMTSEPRGPGILVDVPDDQTMTESLFNLCVDLYEAHLLWSNDLDELETILTREIGDITNQLERAYPDENYIKNAGPEERARVLKRCAINNDLVLRHVALNEVLGTVGLMFSDKPSS